MAVTNQKIIAYGCKNFFNWTLMIDNIKRKFEYIILQFTFIYAYTIAFIYSFLFKKKNKPDKEIKKIAAVWYNPPDITGSNLRLGHWKNFFEEEGYQYDNFYVGSIKEYQNLFANGSWAEKYYFYRLNLLRRLKQFFQLKNYDVVWIDRGFVIAYPLKKAFFERCIKRMVGYVVVDSTDGGDYDLNPELVMDTMKQADRVTVGFNFLKNMYSEYFKDVVQFNWTIPEDNYSVKKDFRIKDLPVIGWMGSPGNFIHVKDLEEQLQKVAEEIPFRFIYICRSEQNIDIPGAIIEHHLYGEDYFDLIASFDVGIAPYLGDSIRLKGKMGMKHQEFLLCSIPQVCSPVAISEYVHDRKEVLIAHNLDDWSERLIEVLRDEELRTKLAKESRNIFLRYYAYEIEFSKVLNALTNFNTENP